MLFHFLSVSVTAWAFVGMCGWFENKRNWYNNYCFGNQFTRYICQSDGSHAR